MELAFVKMHGLGNDFIVIEDLAEELEFSAEAVEWFCDRNFGIGGDGLILVRPVDRPDGRLLHALLQLRRHGRRDVRQRHPLLREVPRRPRARSRPTGHARRSRRSAGLKPISVTRADDGTMYLATVDMGEPILAPGGDPTDDALRHERGHGRSPVRSRPIWARSTSRRSRWATRTACSGSTTSTRRRSWRLGPVIENHPMFPDKTNVEFAQMVGDERHPAARLGARRAARRSPAAPARARRAVVASLDAAHRPRGDRRAARRRARRSAGPRTTTST